MMHMRRGITPSRPRVLYRLIPILNKPIQTTSDHLTSLLRMPIQTRNRRALFPTGLKLVIHFPRLPIPKARKTARVTARNKLAIWRKRNVNGIPGIVVATEPLFAVLSELVGGGVHDDLVIAGLESDVFA